VLRKTDGSILTLISGDYIFRVKDGTRKRKWVTVSFTTIMTILYKRVLT
jgi:hypothetical protein